MAEEAGQWDARLEALVVDSLVRGDGADELLPERALDGDADAVRILVAQVYEPLPAGAPRCSTRYPERTLAPPGPPGSCRSSGRP